MKNFATFQTRLQETLKDELYALQFSKAQNTTNVAGKYKVSVYKVGYLFWINRTFMEDAVSRMKISNKLEAKRYCPFQNLALAGQNTVHVDFPAHISVQHVVHVDNTVAYKNQPSDIAKAIKTRPDPVPDAEGTFIFEVGEILGH